MSANSKIEWTDHTFNTHWGCNEVSPGCDNCYARNLAGRFGTAWGVDAPRREFGDKHWTEPLKWNAKAEKAGVRQSVFSNSMSDLFDKNAPAGVRERWFDLTKMTPCLDWLALTKRIGNVQRMLPADWGDGYPNVGIGATVVNQAEADRDIHKLLAVPARVRFLSIEPMLGPVDLNYVFGIPTGAGRGSCAMHLAGVAPEGLLPTGKQHLHWVIAGGESGSKARPMHPDWARSLRDQCAAAGVPFLFKQWGEWCTHFDSAADAVNEGTPQCWVDPDGRVHDGLEWHTCQAAHEAMYRVGKKAAGRLLDGVLHDGFPS